MPRPKGEAENSTKTSCPKTWKGSSGFKTLPAVHEHQKLQEMKAKGNKVPLKEGRKKWMRAVHSKQPWQSEQGGKPHGKAVVKHAVPHPTAPTGQQRPAWKEAGRSWLPLASPKLIPSKPFPFIIVLFSS